MTSENLLISAEMTPNPNTLKFIVNRPLVETGSLNYPDKEKAKGVLLAETLFDQPNVLGVMIGRDFITVTKRPEASWHTMVEPITATIKSLFASGKALFPRSALPSEGDSSKKSEIEQKIREVLDNEIRPAVAMDGGDITFHGYENGIVTLHLQGSCSSCPSSIMTLKMGVENRLKSLIPEVREVVQV